MDGRGRFVRCFLKFPCGSWFFSVSSVDVQLLPWCWELWPSFPEKDKDFTNVREHSPLSGHDVRTVLVVGEHRSVVSAC